MFIKMRTGIIKPEKMENFSDKVLQAYYNAHSPTHSNFQENGSFSNHKDSNQSDKDEVQFHEQEGNKNKKSPIIISIGGGKGGIGKSFLSTNISIRLATLGFSVAILDLDLGASNLHTFLGVSIPPKGVTDFLRGDVASIEETGVKTYVPNLTLYAGNQDFWQKVKPQPSQKIKFINHLQEMDYDFVLIDLGAGTHIHTLDFFIFSDVGLLVVAPEPTSIENSYVFMKSVFTRKLQNIISAFNIDQDTELQLLRKISHLDNNETPFTQLMQFVENHASIDPEIIEIIKATNIGVIMNQVRTKEDADLGPSMSSICKNYFGFSSSFLGAMRFDDSVWKSIRIRRPLIIDNPSSVSSLNVYKITEELIRIYGSIRSSDEYTSAEYQNSQEESYKSA